MGVGGRHATSLDLKVQELRVHERLVSGVVVKAYPSKSRVFSIADAWLSDGGAVERIISSQVGSLEVKEVVISVADPILDI